MARYSDIYRQTYLNRLIELQKGQNKTKAAGAKNALGVFIGGCVFAALAVFFFYMIQSPDISSSYRGWGKLFLLATAIVGPLMIVAAVGMLVVSLVRPLRHVVCPFCHKEHRLLGNVTAYLCDGCDHLLLLNKADAASQPAAVQCPLCHAEWAATDHVGEMRCTGCGATLARQGDSVRPVSQNPCPSCGQPLAEGAFVCMNCGALATDPSVEGKEPQKAAQARWGLDVTTADYHTPLGNLMQGLWALKKLAELFTAGGDGTQAFKDALQSLMPAMEKDRYIANPVLNRYLDRLLALYYANQLAADGASRFYFAGPSEFDRVNKVCDEIAKLHAALLAHTPPVEEQLADNWPSPILSLESGGWFTRPNGQTAYHAKARNWEKIRAYEQLHGEDVDFAQAAQETIRRYTTA